MRTNLQQNIQRRQDNDISHTDSDEIKLCEVAKHPFGILVLYFQVGFGVLAGLALAYFLLPTVISDTSTAFLVANIFALFSTLIALLIVMLSTFVYRQNRLIVTDRNITQILQNGLFSRKVSQLNMVNVEDVTSVQRGFFATMFGFGRLKVETAGEQMNFDYSYCPRPGYYAKVILNAREKVLGQIVEEGQSSNNSNETMGIL